MSSNNLLGGGHSFQREPRSALQGPSLYKELEDRGHGRLIPPQRRFGGSRLGQGCHPHPLGRATPGHAAQTSPAPAVGALNHLVPPSAGRSSSVPIATHPAHRSPRVPAHDPRGGASPGIRHQFNLTQRKRDVYLLHTCLEFCNPETRKRLFRLQHTRKLSVAMENKPSTLLCRVGVSTGVSSAPGTLPHLPTLKMCERTSLGLGNSPPPLCLSKSARLSSEGASFVTWALQGAALGHTCCPVPTKQSQSPGAHNSKVPCTQPGALPSGGCWFLWHLSGHGGAQHSPSPCQTTSGTV